MAEQLVQAALQASQKASEAVVMMQQQTQQQAATPQQLHSEAMLALQASNQMAQRVQEYQEQQAENAKNRGGFGSYSDASKVVKMPESLGFENQDADHSKWTEFVVGFKAWLTFAEPQFDAGLRDAEAASDPLDINVMSAEEAARSKRLFSVLSGLLRHRPLVILNSVTDRNGYEVWRLLTSVFAPKTKARGLAILSTLMQYPSFTKDRTLREQISALERLAQEYQLVAKKEVQDDLMLGTLIRALPANIRNQVQLQITETSTYCDVKDRVLAFEMVSTTWSHQKVQQELGLPGANPHMQGPGYQGPAPMEIDEVQYKGGKKGGKGKEKGKGKGFGAWQQGGGWPPRSGKGKDGKKGCKGKDKGKTGKGKGQGDGSKCLYCGKPGHWKRDCRQFQRDRENGVIRSLTEGPAQAGQALLHPPGPPPLPETATSTLSGSLSQTAAGSSTAYQLRPARERRGPPSACSHRCPLHPQLVQGLCSISQSKPGFMRVTCVPCSAALP